MYPRFIFFISLFFLHCCSYAQSNRTSMDRSLFTLTAGLNTNDAYALEFSYHYMLFHYLDIGSGIGYFKQWYNEYFPNGKTDGKWNSWTLSESDRKIEKLYLRPSVLLSSPPLFKVGKYKFLLKGEFGVQLLSPHTGIYVDYVNSNTYDSKLKYESTNKGDWCFWNVKGSVGLRAYSSVLSLGYGISNLDIYSSRRFIKVENTLLSEFYPNRKLTHTLFISLSYSF